MQKLQCELCGSIDILRTNDGFFQCQHCGCKYTLEQAKALLGTVETTIGKAELERLLKNAKMQYELGEFSEAEKTYTEVTKQFPDDYRGWLGLQRLSYRYYLYGDMSALSNIRISPSSDSAQTLKKRFEICKKLCRSENTLNEIDQEWNRFWNYIAEQCKSGKFEYEGGCDPEVYKDISPAMYKVAKAGFENARILNSLGVWHLPDEGWVPKAEHFGTYYFWLGNCVQLDNSNGYMPSRSGEILPVIDDAYAAKIKAKVQSYINKCVERGKCPYCSGYIKSSIFGAKCQRCGKRF